jgi:hypothetical protein
MLVGSYQIVMIISNNERPTNKYTTSVERLCYIC